MKEGPCETPQTPLLIMRVKNYLNREFITGGESRNGLVETSVNVRVFYSTSRDGKKP